MIKSAINGLERAISILNDIPIHIDDKKRSMLSTLNDTFEDYRDQLKDNKEGAKILYALKKDVMGQVEGFCDYVSNEVKEEVKIIEE